MKTIKLFPGTSLIALTLLFTTGCKKPAAPPIADTEVKSSVEASYALFTVTDIEMAASFLTQTQPLPDFYAPLPASASQVTANGDEANNQPRINYLTSVPCVDGKMRTGSIFVDRDVQPGYNQYANANSRYPVREGYAGRITLLDYQVDGWSIGITNADQITPGLCLVLNRQTTSTFNPATTNLSWSVNGNFKFQKGEQTMFCQVDLVKTLLNTSDVNIFPPTGVIVNWARSTVAYTGKITGYTTNGAKFTMTIDENHPVIRDFTCTPDKVSGVMVTNGMLAQSTSQYHPFKDGIALFTTGDLYQRQIYYGGSESTGSAQCDNSGDVLIKGIFYPVDFIK